MSQDEEENIDWSNIKSFQPDQIEEKPKTVFDLDKLHTEARARLEMLGFLKINDEGIQQEVSEQEIDDILLKKRRLEDPDRLADRYMMQHGLYDIFRVKLLVDKERINFTRFFFSIRL